MKVELIAATQNPMDVISLAAGCSYGKYDLSHKRVERCFERGHMSVFEHASVTVRISEISRACCDQLTRHRMASFVVQSQRYVKQDSQDFMKPPNFDEVLFAKATNAAVDYYEEAIKRGIPCENARFLLPMSALTEVVMTVDVRELYHMFDMRIDPAAQWEIQNLFRHIKSVLASIDWQWHTLMSLYDESKAG